VNGEHWVEQVGEMDAVGFGDEAEKGAVAVKAPRPAQLDDFDPWLVLPVEEFVRDRGGQHHRDKARASFSSARPAPC
jgi:hypothetical protein